MQLNNFDFNKALDLCAPEVQYYFTTAVGTNFIEKFRKSSSLSLSIIDDLIDISFADNFSFDDIEPQLVLAGVNNENITKVSADFIGMVFGPIAEFLPENSVANALKKRNAALSDYLSLKTEFNELMLNREIAFYDEKVKDFKENFDIREELNAATDLFNNALVEVLSDEESKSAFDLDSGLLYILANDKLANSQLEKAIINNKQLLTANALVVNGTKVQPTIENWINDFVVSAGGGYFDSLVLTKYLISSTNAAKLKDSDKNLLKKLLILYRAIKYYPKSLENVLILDRHILPLIAHQDDSGVFDQLSRPNIPVSLQSQVINLKEKVVLNTSNSKLTPEDEKRQAELMALAGTYPVGSLERRAVEEEIKRMG